MVNFDSLLFYRELTIGTAKPTAAEREGVPHHMIDVRSAHEPMNASDFARTARPVVEAVLPMADVAHAHRRLESNQTFGKLVLSWQ